MNQFEINAESRHDRGKGASRRLRRAGKLPGVVYGAHKDAVAIQLVHSEVLLHTAHEAFYSHILDLKLDGKIENVILKDMQRHPFKPFIMHMDFQRVDAKEELTIRVPIHFLNEDTCIGVKQHGGVVAHLMSDLEITCLPKNLPESINVDVEKLDIGDTIHLADLVMPEGVEITLIAQGADDSLPVVSVNLPRVVSEDEEEGEADTGSEADGDAASGAAES